MIDLISRQALIDMFQRQAYDDWNQGTGTTWANAFSEAADMIENLPSADAVEVVRCADCKYRDADDFCTGRGYPNVLVPDDGFCDKGERSEE